MILGVAASLVFISQSPKAAEPGLGFVIAPVFRLAGFALALLCITAIIAGIVRRLNQIHIFSSQSSIESVRRLDWRSFEHLIAEAFRRRGYTPEVSDRGPDGGIDLRLTRAGQTTLVQCKQWRTRQVGVRQVRELAGVVAANRANGGIFVCSGDYTQEAKAFARQSGIELIDGERLAELLDFRQLPGSFMEVRDSCPQCGNRLVRRIAKRGPNRGNAFMGCSGFPSCRFTQDVTV